MSRKHVEHKDIANFAQNRVNLPADKATEYRAQARRLREKVESYLSEHPDFALRKMMLSGSLAKGTALRSLNDIDVACYVAGADVPSDVPKLLEYITERLANAFPNFSADQVTPQTYSIAVSFKGTGLNVDIVPILYYGDEDWNGSLVSQEDGSFLRTNIPRHLEFMKERKQRHPQDFAQVIRLLKYWARKEKQERNGFRFKSFMIELILAKLSDQGQDFADYPEALQSFFTYIARTGMREPIVFDDFYPSSSISVDSTPVNIIDPVNSTNNVSKLYTDVKADMIVDAALEAGDAIDGALCATTKQETIYYWQKVFGQTFNM